MIVTMSSPNLTPVSYLILGLVARGASTPYALKQYVAKSVGFFWPFPHSQFYSEPARLLEHGLLEETREASGRRRRQFTITAAGQAALEAWLREPTSEQPQIRDTGLLKLFFGEGLDARGGRRARARAGGRPSRAPRRLRGDRAAAAAPRVPPRDAAAGLRLEQYVISRRR